MDLFKDGVSIGEERGFLDLKIGGIWNVGFKSKPFEFALEIKVLIIEGVLNLICVLT